LQLSKLSSGVSKFKHSLSTLYLNNKLNWKDISSKAGGSAALVGDFSQAREEKMQRINLAVVPAGNLPPAFCGGMVRAVKKK